MRATNANLIWLENGKQAIDPCNKIYNVDLILMDIKMLLKVNIELNKKTGCNGHISKPIKKN